MIRVEHPYHGNEELIKHESDAGRMLEQVETGDRYASAVDTFPCQYTYRETDEPAHPEEISDAEALEIITGGAGA